MTILHTKDGDGKALLAHFRTAASHGIKFPKIKLVIKDSAEQLVIYLNGPRSTNNGGLSMVDGNDYPNNKYYGRIAADGTIFVGRDMTNSIAELLNKLLKDPVNTAAINGRETGICCFCARELTDIRSLTHGYGPVCASKYDLPWEILPAPQDQLSLLPEI